MAPLIVGENLSWNQVAGVRSHQSDFPELSVVSRIRRNYPFGSLTAHAVGHLRPVIKGTVRSGTPSSSRTPWSAQPASRPHADSFVAGQPGERWAMVSAVGRQLGIVRETEPTPGGDLGVTLDIELQQAAAEALGDRAGAVVGLDPRNGAVRILYSAPSFDPAVFGGRLSRSDWQILQEDPFHPLQNRCLQGVYPPDPRSNRSSRWQVSARA